MSSFYFPFVRKGWQETRGGEGVMKNRAGGRQSCRRSQLRFHGVAPYAPRFERSAVLGVFVSLFFALNFLHSV